MDNIGVIQSLNYTYIVTLICDAFIQTMTPRPAAVTYWLELCG